jgi:heat-inducible transcriptional repressor
MKPTAPDILDERLRRILTFVVESHVTSAEPVGSQYVRAAYHLSISPATIRNAMQQLEELGFLSHPHTSAGRVPTEQGYRYYVDHLMHPDSLAPATRRALDQALEEAQLSGAIEERLPPTLAHASRHLAVVSLHSADAARVHRFELVGLEGGEILVAVGIEGGPLATTTWRPPSPVAPAALRRAESWVRASLPVAGAEGLDALAESARVQAATIPDIADIVGEALPRAARLVAGMEQPAVRLGGAEHIAAQPEFQTPDALRPLVLVLAEREPLARALESFAAAGSPRVSIGHEHVPAAIQSCSIVGMSVALGGSRAVIGVMGPVRMPYRRVVALLTYVGERLARGRGA